MAQIEYKVLLYPEGITQKTEKEWNQSGKDGWDLVSFGPTALDVTGSVEDSMPGLGNYPKLIGKYGYGSAKLLARVLDVCPRAHLFGHIHNATGIHAGQYSIFSNGTVVNEHYEVCKCGNRLVF